MTDENTQETLSTEKNKKTAKTKMAASDNQASELKALKREVTALRKRLDEVEESNVFFEYTKVRNVQSPTRGTSQSAGIDFYVPNDFNTVDLKPHEDVLIPSGIKVKIPSGTALIFKNKSGIATKLKLMIGAEVVDSDYQGELHLHLINASNKITRISAGMKLTQALLIPYYNVDIVERRNTEDLYGKNITERGQGGFGSTNQNKVVESTPLISPVNNSTVAEPGTFEVWMSMHSMGGVTYNAEFVGKTKASTFAEACKLMYTKNDKLDPRFNTENNSYMGIPLYPSSVEANKHVTKIF